ncbi:hypothetical protein AKJ16_DCAP01894 [Drosera capensis]
MGRPLGLPYKYHPPAPHRRRISISPSHHSSIAEFHRESANTSPSSLTSHHESQVEEEAYEEVEEEAPKDEAEIQVERLLDPSMAARFVISLFISLLFWFV